MKSAYQFFQILWGSVPTWGNFHIQRRKPHVLPARFGFTIVQLLKFSVAFRNLVSLTLLSVFEVYIYKISIYITFILVL